MYWRVSDSDSFEDSSGFGVETRIIGHQAGSREDSQEGLAVVHAEGGGGSDRVEVVQIAKGDGTQSV